MAWGDDWDGEVGGRTVWEQEPDYSPVLGPNGRPLEYVKQPIGFLLKPVQPAKPKGGKPCVTI